MRLSRALSVVVLGATLAGGCGSGDGDTPAPSDVDGEAPPPGGQVGPGGNPDGSVRDGGAEAGAEAGPVEGGVDGGPRDAGADGGPRDSGVDAGGPLCTGASADPAAVATISGYMNTLPYGQPQGAARSQIIDVIIRTCQVFGPPPSRNPGWQKEHCWAQLVASILKESTYNAALTVTDAYATRAIGARRANDPTVGLLQIRFSSTVHDFAVSGSLQRLACVGCTLPSSFSSHLGEPGDSDFWAVNGPAQNLSSTSSVACNVGMGAWYYYYNATSNGNPNAVTPLTSYCGGGGTSGNLITGLRSHLRGPDGGKGVILNMSGLSALQGSDPGAYEYITTIKGWFDAMIPPVAAHPFFVKLAPNSVQYCRP